MDFTEIFKQRYNQLNNEQKQAVDAINGPVLVIAGPGSGKTELLSLRVANILLNTDILPYSILCLTFTDSAAVNMRKRLSQIIGNDAYKVAIHTFHSFGSEIINSHPEYFYNGAIYSPIDELTRREILEEILNDFKHNNYLNSFHPDQGFVYLSTIISRISDLKKGGISPEEFKSLILENKEFIEQINPLITDYFSETISKKNLEKYYGLITDLKKIKPSKTTSNPNQKNYQELILETFEQAYNQASSQESTKPITSWKNSLTKKNNQKKTILKDSNNIDKHLELAEIYEKYQKSLHKGGFYDFDDMILDTVNILEKNPDLKYDLQEKYQYILIDEFQDTSGVQMRMLDNLVDAEVNEGRPNIMAVGDDDQAIFKFQGANLDNIISFHKKYLDPQIFVLTKNYRSTQELLDLFRKVIIQGDERLENQIPDQIIKELEAANSQIKPGKVITKEFQNKIQEYKWLSDEIKNLLNNSHPAKDISIIAPKHKILEEISKILDFYEIPVSYERKKNPLEQKNIKEIILILQFIYSLNKTEKLEADEYLPEILSLPFWGIDKEDIWKISIQAYSPKNYENKKLWLEVMTEHQNEKIKTLANFLINLGAESLVKTAEEIIDYITGSKELDGFISPYKEFYFNENNFQQNPSEYLEYLKNLEEFIKKVREYKGKEAISLNDVINFLDLYQKHKIEFTYNDQFSHDQTSINLMTVHKAKGMEFETVFLVNCQEEAWIKGYAANILKFPANLSLSPQSENIDDKLRLFYVALSRAKRNLYISSHKINERGRENNKLRFINNIIEEVELEKGISENQNLREILELSQITQKYNIQKQSQKDLLKELVKNYQLSVTHLNNFLNLNEGGPQRFLEQNLLRFPQKQNKAGAYGSAAHLALQQFYKEFKKTGQLPSLDFLLNQLKHALLVQRLNDQDYKYLLEKGLEYFTAYYNVYRDKFDVNDRLEFDFKTQGVVVGNAHITGKIDRMHVEPEKKEITVIDYKTGKPTDSWGGRSEYERLKLWKYQNQLIFYKLLVENARDFKEKYRVNTGVLEFLEPDRDQKFHILDLQIDEQSVDRMKKLINVVYNKIINLEFPDISKYSPDFLGTQHFIEDLISE